MAFFCSSNSESVLFNLSDQILTTYGIAIVTEAWEQG